MVTIVIAFDYTFMTTTMDYDENYMVVWNEYIQIHLTGHTSPVGTYKRVEALQVSHNFKTFFAISLERKITMTSYIHNILGYY